MRFENTKVFNFENAFRGMRNPKDSWDKSDSSHCDGWYEGVQNCSACSACESYHCDQCYEGFVMGANDLALAQRLIRAGSEHRKFMRQIVVSVDITAPLYWWKEFDTYKVGTVANSTSTMHTIQNKQITKELFEISDYHPELGLIDDAVLGVRVCCFLDDLEQLRQMFLTEKDPVMKKQYWKELIRWLPEGWLQTRTITMSYENLLAMCSPGQRRFHKQTEWSADFISWARSLPYAKYLIFIDEFDAWREKEKPVEDRILNLVQHALIEAEKDGLTDEEFTQIILSMASKAITKEAA